MRSRTVVYVADLVMEMGADLKLTGEALNRAASAIFKVLLHDYLLITVKDYNSDQEALREVSRLQTLSPRFWLDLESAVHQLLHDVAVKSWQADEVSVAFANNVLLVDLYFHVTPKKNWNPDEPAVDRAYLHRPTGRGDP